MTDILSLVTAGANLAAQSTIALKAASSVGQDPRKMSWNTIQAVAAQNPELGAQYAEIKRAHEAEKLADKQNKQAKKLLKLKALTSTAPAPAPSSNNTILIVGGLALAVILLSKKGK